MLIRRLENVDVARCASARKCDVRLTVREKLICHEQADFLQRLALRFVHRHRKADFERKLNAIKATCNFRARLWLVNKRATRKKCKRRVAGRWLVEQLFFDA